MFRSGRFRRHHLTPIYTLERKSCPLLKKRLWIEFSRDLQYLSDEIFYFWSFQPFIGHMKYFGRGHLRLFNGILPGMSEIKINLKIVTQVLLFSPFFIFANRYISGFGFSLPVCAVTNKEGRNFRSRWPESSVHETLFTGRENWGMFFSRVLFHGTLDKQLVSLSKVTCVSTDFTASHMRTI